MWVKYKFRLINLGTAKEVTVQASRSIRYDLVAEGVGEIASSVSNESAHVMLEAISKGLEAGLPLVDITNLPVPSDSHPTQQITKEVKPN